MEVTTRGSIADRGSEVGGSRAADWGPEGGVSASPKVMTEDSCRPGSAHAGRYQEVRGGEGGERDGMDTP